MSFRNLVVSRSMVSRPMHCLICLLFVFVCVIKSFVDPCRFSTLRLHQRIYRSGAQRCDHPNSTQSALASNTSVSHLQERSVPVYTPWCCCCISTATLRPGQRRLRASTATVCIYSMYSVTEGEDVNGTAKFCVPRAVSLD